MRIVHSIERVRLSIGGTVRAALDMCAGLARLGHEVTLLTLDDTDVPSEWRTPGAPVRVLTLGPGGAPLGRLSGAQVARVRTALRDADVAHIHAVWDLTNAQVARVARTEGVPYVISAHGMLDDWAMAQKRPKKWIYLHLAGGQRYLNEAGGLVFASQSEAEQSPRWAPRTPVFTIPLLFDSRAYETLPGPTRALTKFGLEAQGSPILLFLSRLTPGKRADLVIQASGILHAEGLNHRLVIAGDGDASEQARLRRFASQAGIDGITSWIGGVWGDDKISLYQAASAFALPSDHENFCFALVEAMAAGTPVATVRTVGIWREIDSSGGGTVCSAEPGSLAAAVKPWLVDPSASDQAGRAARYWARETLNMDRVASEYVRMYEEVLRAQGKRR